MVLVGASGVIYGCHDYVPFCYLDGMEVLETYRISKLKFSFIENGLSNNKEFVHA